jgi:hypothetical protein
MRSRENRRRIEHAATIGLVSAFCAFRVVAQSTTVQLAEGSGVQPLFVLDSGAAWSANWFRTTSCVKALPVTGMVRDSIYLDARMDSSTSVTFTTQADLLAHDVAATLRVQLGGSETAAPHIGPAVNWYSIPAELIVTARPDGSMTWRGLSASGDPGAVNVLSAALDSARRHGEGVIIWPDGYHADSVVLRLSLLPRVFKEMGSVPANKSKRMRFLSFTIMRPVETPPLPKGIPRVRYPTYGEQHGVSGSLLAQFVVDTNGKAVMSTFTDLWPANQPRLSGSLENYYTQFVNAVREGVSTESFTPARVGSCTVPQIVQMPVKFVQPHGRPAYQ